MKRCVLFRYEIMSVRIDKWLWAARFFKTRSLARQHIEAGHVKLNGQRVKPAKAIQVGDRLDIRKSGQQWTVDVTGLAEKRGSASVAATLYAETPASRAAREEQAAMRRVLRASQTAPDRKPDKKQRRQLLRAKQRSG